MDFEMSNMSVALPEMFVLGMACLILLIDLFLTDRNRIITYLLAQATLVGAAIASLGHQFGTPEIAYSGTFIRDGMGDVLKVFIYLSVFMVFLYSRSYLQARNMFKGEFYVLGLFGVLGMMVMVSAHSLLTLYLGLELLSLSMYALVAMNRNSISASEAAMKYFVLGALASGMLLYGMSMLYGVTGSLELAQISRGVTEAGADDMVLVFGLVFTVVGIAFKLGAVPFHMWVPDVYQGSPTAVTVYIGSAPKIAAFAMVMRLLVDGLEGLQEHWQGMLIILVILSLALGNITAIAQTNIKRMLAYSTIAHVGYLLLGVLSGTESGYASSMFYTIVYALMSLGGFGMIMLLSRAGLEADRLEDFKGLNERSPWFAFMMLILMFSMAGVPVFLGFWAKLSVLSAVVEAGMVWLAVVAVIFSIIGAFYYLRIVKLMYFDKPEDSSPIESEIDVRVMLSANSLAILALGMFPGALMGLCVKALAVT
ncbi:MAG TPA: NADH-quinone oxidoreductase subunit NuoN [Gammaproteobacteria bacterium]|nr:NADH-quinone oxidoreductase subunit NuoN [Gammaproteobacteria bacterium]